MEKIDLYEACIEKENFYKQKCISKTWQVVGLFEQEEDAKKAVKLYEIVHRAMGEKLLHNYNVEQKSFPQSIRHRYYKRYYRNLDEFLDDNLNIGYYLQINKLTIDDLLNEINERDNKAEKELRIIERLIKEYNDKLHFALMTSSTSEESIEKIEESIKYLESLRDKTTGFTK
ncbi:MAG: hypothetical protein IJ371_01920 [Clostridia bacterium]|nr:hypothetical protein [Clostridia bacterium]